MSRTDREELGTGQKSWKENEDTIKSLHELVMSGDQCGYQELLQMLSGEDQRARLGIINYCFENRTTALIIAVQEGHKVFTKMLVEEGADVSIAPQGRYAHEAAFFNNYLTDVIAQLKKGEFRATNNPSFLKIPIDGGKTLLHYFAEKGQLKNLQDLQKTFGDVFADAIKVVNSETGKSVLHYAAQSGDIALVGWLIHPVGVDRDAQDSEGNTAYHIAAANGDKKLVRVLEFNGVDRTLKNNAEERADQVEVVGLRRFTKGNPLRSRYEPFFGVIRVDDKKSAEQLLSKNMKSIAPFGEVLLSEAVKCGAFKVFILLAGLQEDPIPNIKQLIAQYIDKIIVDTNLLQNAARQGDLDSITKLLALGADVNFPSSSGWSALYYAVNKNKLDAVSLLLENDAVFQIPEEKMWNKSRPLPPRADQIGCASLGKQNCLKLRANEIVKIVNLLKGLEERHLELPAKVQGAVLEKAYRERFGNFREELNISEERLDIGRQYEDVFEKKELIGLLKLPLAKLKEHFESLETKLDEYIHKEDSGWKAAITQEITSCNLLVEELNQLRARIEVLEAINSKLEILDKFDRAIKASFEYLPTSKMSSGTDSEKSEITEKRFDVAEEIVWKRTKSNKKAKSRQKIVLGKIEKIEIQENSYRHKEKALESTLRIPEILAEFKEEEREARQSIQKKQRKRLKGCKEKFSHVTELQKQIVEKDPNENIWSQIKEIDLILAEVQQKLHPADSESDVLLSPEILLNSKKVNLKQLSKNIDRIKTRLLEKKDTEEIRRLEREREAQAEKEQALQAQKEKMATMREEIETHIASINERLGEIPELSGDRPVNTEMLRPLSDLRNKLSLVNEDEGLLSSIGLNTLPTQEDLTGLLAAAKSTNECVAAYIKKLCDENYNQLLSLIQGPVERLNMGLKALNDACANDPEIEGLVSPEFLTVDEVRSEIGRPKSRIDCIKLDDKKLKKILPSRHKELVKEIRKLSALLLSTEQKISIGEIDLELLTKTIDNLNTALTNVGGNLNADLSERIKKFQKEISSKKDDPLKELLYNFEELRNRYTDRGDCIRLKICAAMLIEDMSPAIDNHSASENGSDHTPSRSSPSPVEQRNPRLYELIEYYRNVVLLSVKGEINKNTYGKMSRRLFIMAQEVKRLPYCLVHFSGYTKLLMKLHEHLKGVLRKASWAFGAKKQELVEQFEETLKEKIKHLDTVVDQETSESSSPRRGRSPCELFGTSSSSRSEGNRSDEEQCQTSLLSKSEESCLEFVSV